jgi:arylsulfatase A-like enzyme
MTRKGLSRRSFIRVTTLGAAALASAPRISRAQNPKPNFLFVICDQMNLDAMSYLGNRHVSTPNLDRLAERGVIFLESHSTNPVCSPARSSLLTGRMPVETGVIRNDLPVRQGIPNLGEWLSAQAGYETVYCGKWHLPEGFAQSIPGFRTLPSGGCNGALDDAWVSHMCEAYLRNRGKRRAEPFLLVASFHQPHDICYWTIRPDTLVPKEMPFPALAEELPPLPPNHKSFPDGPPQIGTGYPHFDTDLRWRYYLYCYYRMVEMLDNDVGRLLDALDQTGLAENTVVVFTADHGEGAGRHSNVQKWHPYDESVKVPMIWACPSLIQRGVRDRAHLVSGLDVMSTLCDYAGVQPPSNVRGLSLRPLLEGKKPTWRDHLVCEWKGEGRIVRTQQYKFVTYGNEPKVQLFDMQSDPWETTNLANDPQMAPVIKRHRELLEAWNARMDVAPAQG